MVGGIADFTAVTSCADLGAEFVRLDEEHLSQALRAASAAPTAAPAAEPRQIDEAFSLRAQELQCDGSIVSSMCSAIDSLVTELGIDPASVDRGDCT